VFHVYEKVPYHLSRHYYATLAYCPSVMHVLSIAQKGETWTNFNEINWVDYVILDNE